MTGRQARAAKRRKLPRTAADDAEHQRHLLHLLHLLHMARMPWADSEYSYWNPDLPTPSDHRAMLEQSKHSEPPLFHFDGNPDELRSMLIMFDEQEARARSLMVSMDRPREQKPWFCPTETLPVRNLLSSAPRTEMTAEEIAGLRESLRSRMYQYPSTAMPDVVVPWHDTPRRGDQ